MQKISQPIPVLVALNKSLVSRTKKLCGILRASAETGSLELKIMDEGRDLTPDYVDREVANGIRAFLVGASDVTQALDHIDRLGLPLVTISQPHTPRRNSCSVHTDDVTIAKEAARLFTTARTFNAYAYYPAVDNPIWSRTREETFLRHLQNRRDCPQNRRDRPLITLPRINTAEVLATLPHPVAVLAANDTYAKELIDLCNKAGLRIPTDVSIVGVDNEAFLCESITPSITSIEPDFEREGYEAAKALAQLLAHKTVPAQIACGIKRIVSRKSTIDKRHASALVCRALEYIDAKATDGISVEDVCIYLKVSRRLLCMRFREIRRTSPLEAIIVRKLEALRKELASSDLPISIVCKRCGFGSENHPKKLFRKRYGMTMRDFRVAEQHT